VIFFLNLILSAPGVSPVRKFIAALFIPVLLLGLLSLTGCGETSTTHQLSGTVTFKGSPVPRGTITISPAKGNTGPGTIAEIKDGNFTTAHNKGHVGGKYVLLVNGYDGKPVESGEGGMDPQGKQLFPPYTVAVDLPKENHTMQIDVKETAGP
jgi:hypothetical protein